MRLPALKATLERHSELKELADQQTLVMATLVALESDPLPTHLPKVSPTLLWLRRACLC